MRAFTLPVLAFLLALAIAQSAWADPAVSDSFALRREEVRSGEYNIMRLCIAPGDTLFAYRQDDTGLWRSADGGATWTKVASNVSPTLLPELYATAKRRVLVSYGGYVYVYAPSGASMVLDDTLELECAGKTPASQAWRTAEQSDGSVWIGEYGGASADTCSYIWKGEWTGDGYAWTLENDPKGGGLVARHVHSMHVDPATDWVYALVGDYGAGMTVPDGSALWRKTLAGDWEARPDPGKGWAEQWLTATLGGGNLVLGTDRGQDNATNFFVTTPDDSVFTVRDSLSTVGNKAILPWSGARGTDGTHYVGTVNKGETSAINKIFISRDDGVTWKSVFTLAALTGAWNGVTHMPGFLSTGAGFYHVNRAGFTDDVTYKFTLEPFPQKSNWLVGVGVDCDFSSVAAALEAPYVVAGDTLTLKTGQTHTMSAVPLANMTIMGQGDDRDAVIVRPPGAANNAFYVAKPGVTLANFTIRPFLSGGVPQTQRVPLIEFSQGPGGVASLDVVNVRVAGVGGDTGLSGGAGATGATVFAASMEEVDQDNQVRFIGCAVDSCTNLNGTTRRIISFVAVRRVVIDGCEFNLNASSGAAMLRWASGSEHEVAGYVFILRNSLFNQNTAGGTTGGAVHWSGSAVTTDTSLISHCTFYRNGPTAANDRGQVYWATDNAVTAATLVTNCIFVGNDAVYAMRKIATFTNKPIAKWCNTYASGAGNHLWAVSQNDTLKLDPVFVSTHIGSPIKFMPQNCTVDAQGSSIRVTDQTPASYMGWIDPSNIATEVPELVSPASGKVTPTLCDEAPCVEVEWNTAAYADSYAVRWGETCGEGTYDASYGAADLSAYLGPLEQGTTYYWQVRAKDCGGWGYWSSCRYFTWPSASDPRDHYIGPRWLWWRHRR